MFKKKERNVSNELVEMIENMNFDAPNEKIEEIDAKLNILFINIVNVKTHFALFLLHVVYLETVFQ